MTTADKIKMLRLQKGMTQEELGKACGLQRAAINKYEKGTVVNIKRSVLQKLADALGVAPVYLLDDDDSNVADSEKRQRLYFYINMLNESQAELLTKIAKGMLEDD